MIRSAVAIFVYNRLDTTARVLARVAESRPRNLIVVADGPRRGCPGEEEKVRRVRRLFDELSWSCEVHRVYSEENLGLGRRFSSGLERVFEIAERAIVLEDDTLPDASFFPFCDELLERYRDDARISMISGSNYQQGRVRGRHSYYFSCHTGTYGWATWRRAFRHYDFCMADWPALRASGLLEQLWSRGDTVEALRASFDATHEGRIDTWDYQWTLAVWKQGGMEIVPNHNLITYIGCRHDAVHTKDPRAPYCDIPARAMVFPLSHPTELKRDLEADEFERRFLSGPEATVGDQIG